MPKPLLIDTDVMVDFLRGEPEAVSLVKRNVSRVVLSSVVPAELYAGVRDDEELAVMDRLLALLPVIPVSSGIARAAGLLKRRYAKSHGIGLADAIVAATAEAEDAELSTLNAKHYPMIPGLRPAYRKAPREGTA